MEITLPNARGIKDLTGDIIDGTDPRLGYMVRQFRDQANALYRKNVAEKQKGIADFKCSGGDCCDALWEKVLALVRAIDFTSDDVERNRQINTSYANLYASNPKDQVWAGTAAFVSKQAGCVMRNDTGSPNRALGRVNSGIFTSIYPPLRMHEEGKPFMTPERLRECIEEKTSAMKPKTMDMKKFARLRDGVRKTMDGNGHEAAIAIADYEQKTVAQPIWEEENWLYCGGKLSNTFQLKRTLYLSSECDSTAPGRSVSFGFFSDVTDAKDRVSFYTKDYLPVFEELSTQPGGFLADMTHIRDRTP